MGLGQKNAAMGLAKKTPLTAKEWKDTNTLRGNQRAVHRAHTQQVGDPALAHTHGLEQSTRNTLLDMKKLKGNAPSRATPRLVRSRSLRGG